ncbi:MAG: tetratricopeptide repeat protein [Pseudomonadota bacterium]
MIFNSRFFQQLSSEIRRRKVLRVVAIYAVTAWIVLQFAEISFEPMGYPDWAMRALIMTAIVGFPVTFVLAWVIDITPEGLIFDLPLFVSNEDAPRQRRKSDLFFALLLVLILAGGSYYLVNLLLEVSDTDSQDDTVVTTEAPNSIAVLAFESFNEGNDTDYFAAGLADEILHLLSGFPELNVASRSSSFQFRGQMVDSREIAKRLGVGHVLEGSARQQDDRVRISAELVDGDKGFNRWAQRYERSLDDIFAIQREIAQSVVDELKIVLSISSQAHLDQQATESTDAYVLYLKGAGRLRSSLDADVMRDASNNFQQATDIDANFARAYAGICEAHLRLYEINRNVADFEVAETGCERSAELDPGLNEQINLALGKLYGYRGWFERAEAQLEKAITLAEEPVDAYIELGRIRSNQGRTDEAEKLLQKAHDLRKNYWATHEALASFYYRHDRYGEAIAEYEKAIELAPSVATAYAGKGAAFWMLGEHDKAIEAYTSSLEIKPSRQAHTNIGSLHYYAGRFQKAIDSQLKALDFAPNDHRVWGRLAESYFFLPDNVKAQDAYQRAAELAGKNLEVNDKDWRTTAMLAMYQSHLKNNEDALINAEKAIELSNENAEAYYFKALVRVLLEQPAEAVESLNKAIEIDASYESLASSNPFFRELELQKSQ